MDALCVWCSEAPAVAHGNPKAPDMPLCLACSGEVASCLRCGEPTSDVEARICWDCGADEQRALREADDAVNVRMDMRKEAHP